MSESTEWLILAISLIILGIGVMIYIPIVWWAGLIMLGSGILLALIVIGGGR